MAIETFINVGETTLSVAALAGDATLTLLSGAPFNVAGQFRIRLDDSLQQSNGIATRYEIFIGTFNAGNVINRGAQEGTTAQAWPIGTAVRAIVTAGALANLGRAGQFKARAYQTGGQTIIAGSTAVAFNNESYDPNNNFASNIYTVPAAGFYLVNASLRVHMVSAISGTGEMLVDIFKNGVNVSETGPFYVAVSNDWGLGLSDILLFAAGDQIAVAINNITGNAQQLQSPGTAGAENFVAIHFLSSV